jgi:hypothetical protein
MTRAIEPEPRPAAARCSIDDEPRSPRRRSPGPPGGSSYGSWRTGLGQALYPSHQGIPFDSGYASLIST